MMPPFNNSNKRILPTCNKNKQACNSRQQPRPQCCHNVLHCLQRRTKPQLTHRENFMKFGHVICETCERSDRQTDRQTDIQIGMLMSLETRDSIFFSRSQGNKFLKFSNTCRSMPIVIDGILGTGTDALAKQRIRKLTKPCGRSSPARVQIKVLHGLGGTWGSHRACGVPAEGGGYTTHGVGERK